MRIPLLIAAAAIALAAGCGREDETAPSTAAPASSGSASGGAASGGGTTTTTTPADAGRPGSLEGRKETNPVQQQVDPKEGEQRRDFQQKGDAAGPTSPDTKAK